MSQSNMGKVCADRAIEGLSAALVVSVVVGVMLVLAVGAVKFMQWWMGVMT